MRNSLIAAAAGLLLVAGQAAAANNAGATVRVGDRVGARAGNSGEQLLGIPVAVLLIGGAVLVAAVTVVADDSVSD